MRIDFDRLECGSAFTISAERERIAGGVELVSVPDVLFLPHALGEGQSVCVAQGRMVPVEAILDCWNLGFLQRKRDELPAPRYTDDFDVRRRQEPTCILGSIFARNFGHWTEELLKVAALERAGIGCTYAIPTLPGFARASLSFLGVEDERIAVIDSPTVFARALFVTAVSHQNIAQHPRRLGLLRDLAASRLEDPGEKRKRLWLERQEMVGNAGRLVNPEQVHALVSDHGFEIVDMATLSFPDQLRTVGEASVIAGLHGSQFVHAQFMPPQSTVIECFSPMHVNPSVLEICRALGHAYHQVVAQCNLVSPYQHGRDCLVDCEHLSLILESL